MPTRIFTRAQLDTMGLPNDIVTADYAAEHPEWVTAHPGAAIELHREQTESRRWESVNDLVFRAPDDGRAWRVEYRAPLTEMQDSDPWDYAREVEAVEVEQRPTTVMEWRPVIARPAGLDALLDHVAANLPAEDDDQLTGQKYPCGLGVFCDTCGTTFEGDFVVTDTMTKAQRLAVVRDHVRAELGWQCNAEGDFCPECRTDVPAKEQPEAASTFVPRTERSYWQAIADALNAANAAGMPVGIDLDGTLTDHRAWSVVWDRDAERWALAGYEDDDQEHAKPAPPAPALRTVAKVIREQHDNLAFNNGDMVAAVRDALLDPAVHTPATATAAARVLLAAHARDLAEQARTLARERGAEMRERGDRSRVATCAGMHAVRRLLADHAARLDDATEAGR
ncbi:hypothetical protein ACWC9Q_29670 [Streptomyces sp. NPDC001142]